MKPFKALRVHRQADGTLSSQLESVRLDDLCEGEVIVRNHWSDVNYKDVLAATGAGRIMRRYPLVAGIDLAGEVLRSSDSRFSPGDPAVVIGCGLGEERDGGYAEFSRLPADSIMRLPKNMTLFQSMALGTAGLTAALAIHRLEQNGLHPEMGPVLVNGATGGVGSLAIDMLSGRGYQVTAFTGKRDATGRLRELGASEVLFRGNVSLGSKPLEQAVWAAAVDAVGGEELAWLTRTILPLGCIASIGLAGGQQLNTTVMPFILRGISVLGINSVVVPMKLKQELLDRCAKDLRPRHLDSIVSRQVTLDELPEVFGAYLRGEVTGRTMVRILTR